MWRLVHLHVIRRWSRMRTSICLSTTSCLSTYMYLCHLFPWTWIARYLGIYTYPGNNKCLRISPHITCLFPLPIPKQERSRFHPQELARDPIFQSERSLPLILQ